MPPGICWEQIGLPTIKSYSLTNLDLAQKTTCQSYFTGHVAIVTTPSMWRPPPAFTSGVYGTDKTKCRSVSYNPLWSLVINLTSLTYRTPLTWTANKSKSSRADLKRDACWKHVMYHRMQYGRYVLTDVCFTLIPPDTTLWSQIWSAILYYHAWILAVFRDPRYAARPRIATIAGKTARILFECLPRVFGFRLLG